MMGYLFDGQPLTEVEQAEFLAHSEWGRQVLQRLGMRDVDLEKVYTLVSDWWAAHDGPPYSEQERMEARLHLEWLRSVLEKTARLQPGVTRGELKQLFTGGGGTYATVCRTYLYRTCSWIQVKVEFRIMGRPERDENGRVPFDEEDRDIITKISRPYLGGQIYD